MKNLTQTILTAVLLILATTASAVPIIGSIGFSGSYTHNGSSLGNATKIDITNNSAMVTGTVGGHFAASGITAGDKATYKDFPFSPFSPVNNLWSVNGFSFDLKTLTIDYQDPNNPFVLALSGSGTIKHKRFEDTYATWAFTANAVGANLTFSSGTAPEPGIALLLGVGLAGIGMSRKLRKQS